MASESNHTQKSSIHSSIESKIPLLHKVTVFALGILLVLYAFEKALFNGSQSEFQSPIYSWMIFIFLLSGAVISSVMFKKRFFHDRIAVIHLAVYLLPISYALSMFSAASSYYASQSTIIQFSYVSCFFIALFLAVRSEGSRLLIRTLTIFGYILVMFGLMNWFGDASLWGLFNWAEAPGQVSTVYQHAVLNSGIDARLTSVFQYPNSYAALLMGLLFTNVIAMIHAKKLVPFIVGSLFLFPILLSFILTSSRGAFVVFPIILLITLPFLKFHRQILLLIYLAVSGMAAFLSVDSVFQSGIRLQESFSTQTALQSWLIVISSSLIVSVICFLIFKYITKRLAAFFHKIELKRFSSAFIPVFGVVMSFILLFLLLGTTGFVNILPDSIKSRVERINFAENSVLERGTFYQDATKLWNDYPVLGAGGGAWQTLYEKYQNNPYTSRQAHNFFLQTLVEVGVVGLVSLLLFITLILYHFLRSYWKKPEEERYPYLCFFVIAASILIHSFLDFNMSFVILGALVFLCLGGLLASNELPPFPFQKKLLKNKWVFVYPAIYLTGTIIIAFISLNHFISTKQYAEARANAITNPTIQNIFTPLNAAIQKSQNPEYFDLKLQILTQLYRQTSDEQYYNEAERLLHEMDNREPYYKAFVFRNLDWSMLKNNVERAEELLETAIPNYPWDITLYEELVRLRYAAGFTHLQAGDLALTRQLWNSAISVKGEVLSKAKQLESLPEAQQQGRPFEITPNLALPLGQIYYFQGDYIEAEKHLQLRLDTTFDDSNDFDAAIYYLVSLKKQGKDDPALYETLISKIPDQAQQIDEQMDTLLSQQPIR